MNYMDLNNPQSESVQAALKRKCEVCKAPPGEVCHSLTVEGPLFGRLVHWGRVPAVDK